MLSADDVRAKTPEECSNKHTGVDGDGETVGEGRLEFIAGISRNNGLEEQDQRVDCVAAKQSVTCMLGVIKAE